MYQNFEVSLPAEPLSERVAEVRAAMRAQGLDALLVPRADEHQGEYVPPSAERLRWLTGFAGSAGFAVLALKRAALFVDGRYIVQAKMQVDAGLFETCVVPQAQVSDWLREALPDGARVGFDPWLHSVSSIETLQVALAPNRIELKALRRNLVDLAWGSAKPKPPAGAISVHGVELAGREASDKIAWLQGVLKRDRHDAVVLTQCDNIAWLFNIRGSDVPHTPLALAFAIVPAAEKPQLFVDPAKLDADARAHLKPLARLLEPHAFKERLEALKSRGKTVRLDPAWAAYAISKALGAKRVARAPDPCTAEKAKKNSVELAGARAAHVRDGAAVVRFLAWLDREAPDGGVDEISAVRKLEEFRRETNLLREISFDTISGSGPNGAIVHYRVNTGSNRKLRAGELFLIDSGGQYADGTTDITRTVSIGRPTAEMRERFTLVLKGHIAIATARFPAGTRGVQLDTLARTAMWQHGLDYDHGTGHGVGSYLSVHEGPQSISKAGQAVLEPGMIVSNEPGYYKEGAYGIRIENLLVVTQPVAIKGGEREMLGFETITLAPFDRRLIETRLLTDPEHAWVDAYHARVRKLLGPLVGREDRAWLDVACEPLTRVGAAAI